MHEIDIVSVLTQNNTTNECYWLFVCDNKKKCVFCVKEHTKMFCLCVLDRLSLVYKLITKTNYHEYRRND